MAKMGHFIIFRIADWFSLIITKMSKLVLQSRVSERFDQYKLVEIGHISQNGLKRIVPIYFKAVNVL